MKTILLGCIPMEGQIIEYLFQKYCPEVEYLGQVFSEAEYYENAERLNPDILYFDDTILELSTLARIEAFNAEHKIYTDIVVISASDDFDSVRSAMRLGARDYLLIPIKSEELVCSVNAYSRKGAQFTSAFRKDLNEELTCISDSRTELLNIIISGDVDAVEESVNNYLEHIFEEFQDERQRIEYELYFCSDGIRQFCQTHMDEPHMGDLYSVVSEECTQFMMDVSNAVTADEISSLLPFFALECAEMFNKMRSSYGYSQVLQAKKIIDDNIDKPITLDFVANQVYISPFYLSRLFKSCIGMNYGEYVIKKRLEIAKKLLLTTSDTIESISVAVGYNEPNSFRRLFKKREGVSPSSFRKGINQDH